MNATPSGSPLSEWVARYGGYAAVVLLSACLLLSACATSASSSATSSKGAKAVGVARAVPSAQIATTRTALGPAAVAVFVGGDGQLRFKSVYSQRFGLSVPLPDRPGWLMRRENSRFLILDHAASSSRLLLRSWRETENMNRDKCEQRARIWRDIVSRDKLIAQRLIDVPRGYDTRVDVGFSTPKPGQPLRGYVLAFGASIRQCFAFVFTTEQSRPNAKAIVGERLALVHGRVLKNIKLRSALDLKPGRRP